MKQKVSRKGQPRSTYLFTSGVKRRIESVRPVIDKKPIIALPTTETEHSEKNVLLGTQSSGAFPKVGSVGRRDSLVGYELSPSGFPNKTPGTMFKPPKPPEALRPKKLRSPKGVNGLSMVIPIGTTQASPINPQVQKRWAEPSTILNRLIGQVPKNDTSHLQLNRPSSRDRDGN